MAKGDAANSGYAKWKVAKLRAIAKDPKATPAQRRKARAALDKLADQASKRVNVVLRWGKHPRRRPAATQNAGERGEGRWALTDFD